MNEELPLSDEPVAGFRYRHLLLATDFSAHANNAARRAVQLAGFYQARVSLIQVLEPAVAYHELYDGMAPVDLAFDRDLDEAAEQAAKARLQALAGELGPLVTSVEVLFGSPKREIVRYAEEQGVDLIVVGSHGHHGLSRLLGSTADGVSHRADCDVLSVRLPSTTA